MEAIPDMIQSLRLFMPALLPVERYFFLRKSLGSRKAVFPFRGWFCSLPARFGIVIRSRSYRLPDVLNGIGSGCREAVAVGSDLGSDLSFTKPASILAGSEVAVQGAGIYRKIYIINKNLLSKIRSIISRILREIVKRIP